MRTSIKCHAPEHDWIHEERAHYEELLEQALEQFKRDWVKNREQPQIKHFAQQFIARLIKSYNAASNLNTQTPNTVNPSPKSNPEK